MLLQSIYHLDYYTTALVSLFDLLYLVSTRTTNWCWEMPDVMQTLWPILPSQYRTTDNYRQLRKNPRDVLQENPNLNRKR